MLEFIKDLYFLNYKKYKNKDSSIFDFGPPVLKSNSVVDFDDKEYKIFLKNGWSPTFYIKEIRYL